MEALIGGQRMYSCVSCGGNLIAEDSVCPKCLLNLGAKIEVQATTYGAARRRKQRTRRPKTSVGYLQYADHFTRYYKGDVIFSEGEVGTCMYVVKSGAVEIRVANKPVEVLKEGDMFGEMAMLEVAQRSATAIAITNTELVPIDSERFERLMRTTPYFSKDVMNVLATRLRRMNQEMVEMYRVVERMRISMQIPGVDRTMLISALRR
jgi:CRP/FNR family transcriptional regulator, cyclic AMP receptor protein